MTSNLEAAENALMEQRAKALETFREKLAEANEAAEIYERLDAAIAVLTSTPKENAVAALKKGRKKAKKPGSKTSTHATKEQVQPALKAVITENPGITKDDAEELVKHQLKELGLGIIGVSAQVRKYLASDQFTTDDAGRVSLAVIAVDDSNITHP